MKFLSNFFVFLTLLVIISCSSEKNTLKKIAPLQKPKTVTHTNVQPAVKKQILPKKIPLWSSAQNRGSLTKEPISGKINGKDVLIKSVKVKKWDDHFAWTFSSVSSESPCDLLMDDDAVNFSSKELHVGTFTKKIDQDIEFNDYHAWYHYEQENGIPMSVNTDWSAVFVVNKVDKANKKVKGWTKFTFKNGKTMIEGKYQADYCE